MVESDRPQMAIRYSECAIAFCVTKTTNAHSEYVILLFYGINGYANAPRCYDIRKLHVLFLQLSNRVALCHSLSAV
jgi:hypothetical protein